MAKLRFFLACLALSLGLATLWFPPLVTAQVSRVISVPTLGVRTDGLPGVVNHVLIQFERIAVRHGPVIDFNQINLGGGSVVGGLPSKLEAASGGHYRSLVISRYQPYTSDWPQGEEAAARLRVALIQVGTLAEAYEAMTGGGR